MNRSSVRIFLGALVALFLIPLAAAPAHAAGTYTITGTVTGTDGTGKVIPLSGVSLWIDDYQSGGDDGFWTYTGDDGSYQATTDDGFNGAGPWEIEGYCDDGDPCYDTYGDVYAPTSYGSNGSPTQVPATAGTPVTVDLQMQRWGTITGTITDAAGKPVTKALDWSGFYDGAGETTYAVSGPDAAGTYTISHVRPGDDLSFRVSDPSKTYGSYYVYPFKVAQGPAVTHQDITLDPPSSITETVTDTDGNPLPHMTWNVWEQQADGTWLDQEWGPRPLDENGSYTLDTTIGHHYKICAYDDDYSGDYQPSVRYRTTCWTGTPQQAADEQAAATWTPSVESPTLDATIKMPVAGKSLTVTTPWVDGPATVGAPLAADVDGVWGPGKVALKYQWVYESSDPDADGVADFRFWEPIAGATSATYTPTADMDGKRLAVQVTGTESGYADATASSNSVTVGATHPTLATPLTITGSTAPGSTLTASYGLNAPETADNNTALTWTVDGRLQDVSGKTLTITSAMAGKTIAAHLQVYDNPRYEDELDTSASVTADGVTAGTAAISGTPAVGETLTASVAGWRPSTITPTYQWYADGNAITGATGSTLTLTGAQAGHAITVEATGSRSGETATATSDATAKVTKATGTTGTVSISGTAQVGQTLTASTANWDPDATLAYQWNADGKPITGATGTTYAITSDQAGATITLTVTATRDGYGTTTATSDPVDVPAATDDNPPPTDGTTPPATTPPPVKSTAPAAPVVQPTAVHVTAALAGKVRVGAKVKVRLAGVPAGAKVAYQWLRNGKRIKHATKAAYKLKAKDKGKRISVRITVTVQGKTSTFVSRAKKAKKAKAGHHRLAVPGSETRFRHGRLLTL